VYGSFHASDNLSKFDFNFKPDDTTSSIKFNYSSKFASSIQDICLKSSINWKLADWNTWKTGVEVNNYFFNNSASINDYEKGDEKRSPFLIAGYTEDKIKLGAVIVRPGVRVSKYSLSNKAYAEPRINAVVKLGDDIELRAAWGIYYQYITSMNTSEFEMTQLLDYYYPLQNVKPAQSTHYIAGMNYRLNQSTSLSFDAYYKDISRIYTFNLTQSEIEAFNFSDKIQEGKGKAMGLEVLLKGQYKKFSGWTSIGLSRSTRSYPQYMNGDEYLSDYDRTFTFKGVCNYQVTEKLSYSMSWLALSGHPATIAQTQQYYSYYDPTTHNLSYSPQYIADVKNNARLPMVIQVDVGFRKQLRSGFGLRLKKLLHANESYLTGSVQNLTFLRRNIDYYFYVPPLNYYMPFGMNYFPVVTLGYGIKF
jgi:ferric enterobactin receptor